MPILAYIFVFVVLIMAFAIDAGYAFMKRRDLQRAADMAALAGAQTLPGCANATSFDTVARANITSNLGSNVTGLTISTSCGIWTSPPPSSTTPGTFVAATAANAASGNAVSVTLTLGVPSFFQLAGTRTIGATAVARKAPAVVTFTVDSGLLALNASNSVLAPLLTSIGITPSVYVGAAQQLVGVNITPKGLLQALGVPVTGDVSVASLSGVAAVKNLTVGTLLSATNTALATQNGALSASVTAMNNLVNVFANSPVLNVPVNLLGTATTPGIIANIDAAGVSAANALSANVGIADLITTAVVAANGSNAVAVPSLSILGGTVSVVARVISPPQIGVGGIGATATTAQVRLFLTVNSAASGAGPLGGLLSAVGTTLNLPLVLEVARSTATVTALQCGAAPSTTLQVNSGLVNVCVGGTAAGVNVQTNPASCTTLMTQRTNIATLLGLINVGANVNLSLVTNAPAPITFAGPFPQKVGPIGSSVNLSQIVTALLTGLSLDVSASGSSTPGTIGTGLVNNVPSALAGSSITTVNAFLSSAANGLQQTTNALGSTLGGVLTLNLPQVLGGVGGLVGGLVNTLGGIVSGLLGGISDLLCNLSGNANQCRIDTVANSISTSNVSPVLGSVLYTLLNPLLTPLSNVINTLLSSLGITLGMTTVTVDSINCQNGLVQLVY
ncbi:pilus assembly protein TadG-related protein [Pandoraea captiosa]|uniref:pilus assembly protein TadG-related protein n=1 Tax=Pandoraea captiosa TaxID=2508302 RepID=UPI00158341D6|nr:pilus assembly protein TadG-related protein [Pandoraea captiosa]